MTRVGQSERRPVKIAPFDSQIILNMETIDCAVIGACVVGLAIARKLALAGREVVILQAEDAFGTHTSARNSEVIHAGIYYATGSMKAKLCVTGRKQLYQY